MVEIICLKSKSYCFRTENNYRAVCKGFSRNFSKNLNFHNYKETLFNDGVIRKSSVQFASKKQTLYTIRKHSLVLTAFDSKRYILQCKVHSYGFGHTRIKKYGSICFKCKPSIPISDEGQESEFEKKP